MCNCSHSAPQTNAATLGAHYNPARLTDHHFSFSSDTDFHNDPVNIGALEVYSESPPSSARTARTTAECDMIDVPVQEAPVPKRSRSQRSILNTIQNRQTETSEPTVYAAGSRNLDTSLACLFPATGRLSIPAAPSSSARIHEDNALHRQMCNQSHVASEVEDQQQPSCRRSEDGLDNADDRDTRAADIFEGRPVNGANSFRLYHPLTRAVDRSTEKGFLRNNSVNFIISIHLLHI